MNYRDPELRDLLAGQYVLGTLQGAARARFERLLRRDAPLRQLVRQWEERLTPLAAEIAPVAPPARVFAAIRRRIETGDGARATWWERLGVWRAFSAVGAAAVVVLAVTVGFLVLRTPTALAPSYVAVLADMNAAPAIVVTAFKSPWRVNIETLAPPTLPPGKVLQVWAVEKDTGVVRPLVAFTPGQLQQHALSEADWKLIRNAHALAVNIEPAGSNPSTPTTPVLYSGLCLSLKGV
jgi:anti-sigma-K factor RskA